jgi:SAM-dependent methyltransferase
MQPHLDTMFSAINEYGDAYRRYKARDIDRQLDPTDREYRDKGSWRFEQYFRVGEDALRLIVAALISNGRPFPERILDFPSGSGRVTRHLRAFFPEAEIWASDIQPDCLAFCSARFGAKAKMSQTDFTDLDFGAEFDLIFCGSLLTHLTEDDAKAALALISRTLSPTGIALVTFHGRYASHVQRHLWKYVDDDAFHVAESKAATAGFGFAEYRRGERERLGITAPYGVSLIKPRWAVAQLEANLAIRLLGYSERAWDDHQDVVIFGRPGIDAAET